MKKEHLFLVAIGLFILSYVLDAIVNPLTLSLPSPYHFFTPETLSKYPFTSTTILMKTTAAVLVVILTSSVLGIGRMAKGASMLVVSALMQLYALQDVVSGAQVLPLEWSLALTLSGLVLLLPALFYLVAGMFSSNDTPGISPQRSASSDSEQKEDDSPGSFW